MVKGKYFTDRSDEVIRLVSTLLEPQAKLVLYGPRRMGKSSALEVAAETVREKRGIVVLADLSTASGEADMAIRLLAAATVAFGRRWRDLAEAFVQRSSVKLTLALDPLTQLPSVSLEPGIREAGPEEQRKTFGDALDAIDALASTRKQPVGVVLDEFQEIHKFGGEDAEWHLRGVIQRHQYVAYVLAGSRESLIQHMTSDKGRAFYQLAEKMRLDPIDAPHMAHWIDERFLTAGVQPHDVGKVVVTMAGPRTLDRVRLARATYALAAAAGEAAGTDVARAHDAIVDEQSDEFSADFRELTALQQNLLRAVSAGASDLYSSATRTRFALGKSTSSTARSIERLVQLEHLVRVAAGATAFDNPFFATWVRRHTLVDVGIVVAT